MSHYHINKWIFFSRKPMNRIIIFGSILHFNWEKRVLTFSAIVVFVDSLRVIYFFNLRKINHLYNSSLHTQFMIVTKLPRWISHGKNSVSHEDTLWFVIIMVTAQYNVIAPNLLPMERMVILVTLLFLLKNESIDY